MTQEANDADVSAFKDCGQYLCFPNQTKDDYTKVTPNLTNKPVIFLKRETFPGADIVQTHKTIYKEIKSTYIQYEELDSTRERRDDWYTHGYKIQLDKNVFREFTDDYELQPHIALIPQRLTCVKATTRNGQEILFASWHGQHNGGITTKRKEETAEAMFLLVKRLAGETPFVIGGEFN